MLNPKKAARLFLRSLSDILWPPVCAACSCLLPLSNRSLSPKTFFCHKCLETVEYLPQNSCPLCAQPYYSLNSQNFSKNLPGHTCGSCLKTPPPYQHICSAVSYQGAVAKAIIALKYHGKLSQIRALSSLTHGQAFTLPLLVSSNRYQYHPEAIIPMPLSPEKLALRGFNQATELAHGIYKPWRNLINENLLKRVHDGTNPLATLTRAQRQKAICGCFEVPDHSKVKGLNLLLFDDVLTTGATIREVTKVLLKAGANQVYVATLARTPLHQG